MKRSLKKGGESLPKGILSHKTNCESCGSSDANQIYEQSDGTQDATCFSCGHYTPPKRTKKDEVTNKVKSKVSLSDIKALPTVSIRDRKLDKATLSLYGVKTALSEEDGKTVTEHYYPDTKDGVITGYECRKVKDKNFYSIGDRKGKVDLWGKQVAERGGNLKLFVTEGRCDAVALYQSIEANTPAKYRMHKPSVVSLTRGASSGLKDCLNNRVFLEKYKEVILVLDNDSAGEKAVKDIIKTFPLFKVASLPLKDANDMIIANRSKELYKLATWDSKVRRQGEVLDITDFIEKALEKPKMGISFPWPTVTKACFGIRPNTIHIVGAAPKIGKTDHQHQLVEHLLYNEEVKVGMFDLENAPTKTAKKIAGKHDKLDYTRPDIKYNDDDLRSTLMSMNEKIRFYDRSASRDWEDIKIAIEEMHILDGINIFIIDPLTALISMYSSSEANDVLNEIMTEMADLVLKHPITIFCYSHVNPKPKGSKSHEAGGKVYSSEFTGSRAMEKWAHYGHGISRDRTEDCPDDRRNISEFRMLFDREFGQHYGCDVYFDEKTITYLEVGRLYG